jgi:two-component system phosphate regulon response regulator PhoB
VRSIVYRFDDLAAFRRALQALATAAEAHKAALPAPPSGVPGSSPPGAIRELAVPAGEHVGDGEWVLAIFELGAARRATAAAARGIDRGGGRVSIGFERRDWERLCAFAEESRAPPDPAASAPAHAMPTPDDTLRDRIPESLRKYEDPFVSSLSPSAPVSRRTPEPVSLSQSGRHAVAVQARVLLVDDDEATLEMVSAMLEAVGLMVQVTSTAEEALDLVRSGEFNLVVLDWNLPEMGGLELCREIRREPDLAWLPLLFLTANTNQKDLVEAFASGADDYMLKPFRAPELGARIFSLLRRIRITRDKRA